MKSANRILLIGNSGLKRNVSDGQTEKTRLYIKKISDEGFNVEFIELECFFKHLFSTMQKIKRGIKRCDRIVLLAAERGSRFLIPYINRYNKKYKRPFVLPLIGTSVLHYSIDKLDDDAKNDFIINGNYALCKSDNKMSKELSKLSYILPETNLLTTTFQSFYNLNNVRTLNNFRETMPTFNSQKNKSNKLKLVFLSRVMRQKGVFDLIENVKRINEDSSAISLDIYGKQELDKNDIKLFESYLDNNIHYHNQIDNSKVIETLSKYDLFVFPTQFVGEGTPGVITESLLAGTPILSSNFPQAFQLLKNNYDSIFFNMFDKNDLETKLIWAINNKPVLSNMRLNALKSSESFTYNYNRHLFLKYICGADVE